MNTAMQEQLEYTSTLREEIEKLKTKLRQSLRKEQLTQHILQFLDHSVDVDHILQVSAQEMGQFFEADRCLVISHEDKNVQHARIAAQYRYSDEIITVQPEDVSWIQLISLMKNVDKSHPFILLNVSAPDQFPAFIQEYCTKYHIQSLLSLEIRYRDMSFGRIGLHQCRYSRVWSEWEVDFLHSLIPYIGSALYQAELYQQEQEAKRRAEEANRKKSKILAYVAHDFKNPLSGILRFIDMLQNEKNGSLSVKQQEIIHHIMEGIQLLQEMVSNILDRARLEDGEMKPVPKWLDLSLFMEELRFLLESMVSEKNITLQIHIQPSLSKIYIDPIHLKQILINLVSNAVKYNRDCGQILVRLLRYNSTSEMSQTLLLEVEDTGLGIPQERLPHLFSDY